MLFTDFDAAPDSADSDVDMGKLEASNIFWLKPSLIIPRFWFVVVLLVIVGLK